MQDISIHTEHSIQRQELFEALKAGNITISIYREGLKLLRENRLENNQVLKQAALEVRFDQKRKNASPSNVRKILNYYGLGKGGIEISPEKKHLKCPDRADMFITMKECYETLTSAGNEDCKTCSNYKEVRTIGNYLGW